MRIIKCDICKKKITYNTMITVGRGLSSHELCEDCSAPVLKLIEKIEK